ncbi:chemotaxis protein, partial [Lysobacter sp. D1-1-M9]
MVAAWLVFAWYAYRPGNSAMVREQTKLLNELRTFVNSEIQGSRTEIERTRELIRESVGKLGGSFEAVNRKSRQQSEIVTRIIDRTGEDGGMDVHQFALQASQKMEQLVEALEEVSGQSGNTVTHIDAMAEHLDG